MAESMNRSHEWALAMLAKAEGDALLVARLVAAPELPVWLLGFHAQQACEKALKAVLANVGMEYPRTHDLRLLLDFIRDAGIAAPPDEPRLDELTPFGVAYRYPADPEEDALADVDATWALAAVNRTLAWAATQVYR